MKRILLAVALVALLAPQANADMPWTIAAASTGKSATSMNKGENFVSAWAGFRTKVLGEHTAVYTTYQNIGMNGGETGHGLKALLISGSSRLPWLEVMVDIGFAGSLAEKGDGSTNMALTVGGGFAVTITEHIAPFFYYSAYDGGPAFIETYQFGLAVIGLETLFGAGD